MAQIGQLINKSGMAFLHSVSGNGYGGYICGAIEDTLYLTAKREYLIIYKLITQSDYDTLSSPFLFSLSFALAFVLSSYSTRSLLAENHDVVSRCCKVKIPIIFPVVCGRGDKQYIRVPRPRKGTVLFRVESTPISISGHLEARHAQAASAPLYDFDQQPAFLVGRDERPKLVERTCARGEERSVQEVRRDNNKK